MQWTAGFQFRDKTYLFVVNGRTGKVRGERPYSVIKIALAGIAATACAAALVVALSSAQSGSTGSGDFNWGFDNSFRIDWGREPQPSRWPQRSF